MSKFTSFAAMCAAAGKNEQDYQVLDTNPAKVNAAICADRMQVMAKAYNGDRKVDLTDTSQIKYTPYHWIEKDESSRFGFRLGFSGCGGACVRSFLGARPPFVDKNEAVEAGKDHVEEFEQWLYWQNKAYQEL
jgi:hypothetical protein